MIDNYDENKWDKFELSGKISDYLDYVGIPTKIFSNITAADVPSPAGGGTDVITVGDKASS